MNEETTFARVPGRIRWFNQFKGYGFVEVENIPGDVFLHFSVVDKSGIGRLSNNDVILCNVVKSGKGYQIRDVIKILHFNKCELEGNERERVEAIMKWFNPLKGFGFAQIDSGEDVFIHSSLLRKLRLTTIESGQKVKLTVRRTNLGYEALDVDIEE